MYGSPVLDKAQLAVGTSRYGSPVTPYHDISSVFGYARELANLTKTWFYVSASLNNVGLPDHALTGEWVGVSPIIPVSTRANWIGPSKVIALLKRKGIKPGRLYRTPCRGMKYAGGLRLQDKVLDLTLSVSKLDQVFDQLFAAIIMYQFMLKENQIPTLRLYGFQQQGSTSYLTVSVKDKAGFQRFIEAACGVKMNQNKLFEIPGMDDPKKMFVLIVV